MRFPQWNDIAESGREVICMKKWIVLFMAAFFCISMVGCAGTGDGQIGYIVEGSIPNDSADLYYCIGQRGSEMGNPENRYIEVEK